MLRGLSNMQKSVPIILIICLTFLFVGCSFHNHHNHDENSSLITVDGNGNLRCYLSQNVTIEMKKCKAGTFIMGSPDTELNHGEDEVQHNVTISNDFYMGVYEVTNEQYKTLMGTTTSQLNLEDKFPVENISWDSINNKEGFIAKLNEKFSAYLPTGYKFSLPTEAQWEYACRAGTQGPLNYVADNTKNYNDPVNIGTVAWYSENSNETTHEVGKKTANSWGLYDMHGNVLEWCLDSTSGEPFSSEAVTDPIGTTGPYKIMRGSAWEFDSTMCRSAHRFGADSNKSNNLAGFRLAIVKTTN